MSDLEKLIEAVEAGLPLPTNWRVFSILPAGGDTPAPILAHRAYHGSIDAAKALQEALLPEWRVQHLCNHDFKDLWWCSLLRPTQGDDAGNIVRHSAAASAFDQEVAARAWLLAILRAYAAQQEPTP